MTKTTPWIRLSSDEHGPKLCILDWMESPLELLYDKTIWAYETFEDEMHPVLIRHRKPVKSKSKQKPERRRKGTLKRFKPGELYQHVTVFVYRPKSSDNTSMTLFRPSFDPSAN